MKVAVIGGGSTYTPELVTGFLERIGRLPVRELWLVDVDRDRLDVVGGLARRMIAAAGDPFTLHLTDERLAAVEGADYVITQLRVGQLGARRDDEYLGRRHGLVGQETTGIGGLASALRTVPVVLDIADEIRRSAPGALLVNFTNPSGLVTQALSQHSDIASVGLCNEPLTTSRRLVSMLSTRLGVDLDPAHAELDSLGLNHLTWHRGLTIDGVDHWSTVLEAELERVHDDPRATWARPLLEEYGLIPNSYLAYFLDTGTKLAAQQAWPPSRAEVVSAVEADLLVRYADPSLMSPPAELALRGGANYSTAATELIADHACDSGTTHVVDVANNGAVPDWPDEWVVEIPTTVARSAITPRASNGPSSGVLRSRPTGEGVRDPRRARRRRRRPRGGA